MDRRRQCTKLADNEGPVQPVLYNLNSGRSVLTSTNARLITGRFYSYIPCSARSIQPGFRRWKTVPSQKNDLEWMMFGLNVRAGHIHVLGARHFLTGTTSFVGKID